MYVLLQKTNGSRKPVRLFIVRHLVDDTSQGPGYMEMDAAMALGTYVIHLVRDSLEPALGGLDAGNHVRELSTDDRLGVEGFAKDYPLVRPFQTLLDYPSLGTQARSAYHPSLVVEVAEDHRQTLVQGSKGVRQWHSDILEGNVGGASG